MIVTKTRPYCGLLMLTALITISTPGCASQPAARQAATSVYSGGNVKYARGVTSLGYAIQMGAFANVHNAERFTNRLQAKGIDAFYYRKDNGIYAVRFGDFPSKERAQLAARQLVADRLIDEYYIAPPNEVVFKTSRPATISAPTLPQKPTSAAPQDGAHDIGYIAARTAERFIGIPYQWGGNTVVDGMDCSGFTRAVYNLCGINIPRTSREQYNAGNAVSKNNLQDGDLVFFGPSASGVNHVGIYVGDGKFVHAPSRGKDISIASLDDSYFMRNYVGAKRYVN